MGHRDFILSSVTVAAALIPVLLLGSGLRLRADRLREKLLGKLGLLIFEQEAWIHDRHCLRPTPINRLTNDLRLLLLHYRQTARPILEHLLKSVSLVLKCVAIRKASISGKKFKSVMGREVLARDSLLSLTVIEGTVHLLAGALDSCATLGRLVD